MVAYGFDLTSTSIFVVTEWHAAIGTSVLLRLSFPKLLEPIDVTARISDIRVAGEPGEPGGIGCRSTRIRAISVRSWPRCSSACTRRW